MSEEKKLGQEPAFPIVETEQMCSVATGMSKRFYAACMAMQGLLSNPNVTDRMSGNNGMPALDMVNTAYEFADELLKQENK